MLTTEENKFKIYMIINKITGKYYVGKTINSLENRLKIHSSKNSKCRYLKNSIQKHRKGNFCIVQIGYPKTKQEMNEMEIKYINELKCRNTNIGYNLRAGGEGGEMDDSSKQLISISQTGKKRGVGTSIFYGVSKYLGYNVERWDSCIQEKGEKIFLGRFQSELEAALAYNNFILLHKLKRPLNNVDLKELEKVIEIREELNFKTSKCIQYIKDYNNWQVSFDYNCIKHYVGIFATKTNAIKAYNKYLIDNGIKRTILFIDPIQEKKDYIFLHQECTKIKGIYWSKQICKWIVAIYINKERIKIGKFKNKIDAIKALDNYAKKKQSIKILFIPIKKPLVKVAQI